MSNTADEKDEGENQPVVEVSGDADNSSFVTAVGRS